MYDFVDSSQPRRNFQKIEHDLTAHKDIRGCLEDLMVLLRSPQNRLSEAAKDLIQQVVSVFDERPLEVLRVLINFCADDTENRRYLLSNEPFLVRFWKRALELEIVEVNHAEGEEGEEENTYLMILIGQFVAAVEDDEKKEFIVKMEQMGVISWVFNYHEMLQMTRDGKKELRNPMEFLVEYAKVIPEKVTNSQFYKVVDGYMASVDDRSEYKDVESFDLHADFMFNCTNVNDSTENFPVEEIQHMFIEVPKDCDERVSILRKLFATCGNIYSFPSYDNWQDLDSKVKNMTGGWSFLMASAAISLGNCVSSKETQEQLIKKINQIDSLEYVAKRFLRHQFEDVIYYQGYHFFNNVMNKKLAVSLVTQSNAGALYENTKIIVDNFPYYKEVGMLYLKFLGKLVNLAFLEGTADITLFSNTWTYLLNIAQPTEVLSSVLQAYCRKHATEGDVIQSSIVKHLLTLESTIDINALLHIIKALSVFLKSYTVSEVKAIFGNNFEKDFISQITEFLTLLDSSTRAPAQSEAPIVASNTLANNTRFLALLVQQTLDPMQAEYGQAAKAACTVAARMVSNAGK